MKKIVTCLNCKVEFSVPAHREHTAKYCSKICSDKSMKAKPNVVCSVCNKPFHRKTSHIGTKHPICCSYNCMAIIRSKVYLGDNNPNFKNRNKDHDGYKLETPAASHKLGIKRRRLHVAVALEALGISQIPKGFHVHHRDCDIRNNQAENLSVLSVSDHKWIHKQFGSATLWAYRKGKISLESIVSWSDDMPRARRLLVASVKTQNFSEGLYD